MQDQPLDPLLLQVMQAQIQLLSAGIVKLYNFLSMLGYGDFNLLASFFFDLLSMFTLWMKILSYNLLSIKDKPVSVLAYIFGLSFKFSPGLPFLYSLFNQ